ncbi:MAG TPA: hypothetical protein PKL78_14830 [Anaerolineales bacterium]|nr:hypothetical protein [Anaerolineales bacterium]HNN14833.1 hypothetical protein [Anaerolineales bacterium]HNO32207.1 hypothetical protein [Anaerolineales bacterium]
MTIHKWGGLASFALAASFIVAPFIYLVGNLRDTFGILAYDLADLLYGPVLAAGLVTVTYVLRERLRGSAPHRMDLALMAALLAASGMAAVAFIRASNRLYHLQHPELHLENSATVLTLWTTLVAGISAFGFHFLGWMNILLGSAGWTSRFFPRLLSGFYFLAGVSALFVYRIPGLEGLALLLGTIISIWQGILLWKQDAHPPAQ